MVPVFLILPFLLSFLYPRQTATYHEPLPELSTDNIDINDEIESALGISWLKEVTTKMRKFQELNFTAQIGLEWLANMLESVENLFNFSVPFVSIVAIVLLLCLAVGPAALKDLHQSTDQFCCYCIDVVTGSRSGHS